MKFGILGLAVAALVLFAGSASAQWVAGPAYSPYGYSVILPAGGYPVGGYSSNGFSRPAPVYPDYGNGLRYSGVANMYANPTTYSPLWTPSATNLHFGVPYYGSGMPSYGYSMPSYYRGNSYGGYCWRW